MSALFLSTEIEEALRRIEAVGDILGTCIEGVHGKPLSSTAVGLMESTLLEAVNDIKIGLGWTKKEESGDGGSAS